MGLLFLCVLWLFDTAMSYDNVEQLSVFQISFSSANSFIGLLLDHRQFSPSVYSYSIVPHTSLYLFSKIHLKTLQDFSLLRLPGPILFPISFALSSILTIHSCPLFYYSRWASPIQCIPFTVHLILVSVIYLSGLVSLVSSFVHD